MTQGEFNKKVSVVIAALSKLVWALVKIQINELSEEVTTAPLASALTKSCDELVDSLNKLGIKTELFENFDIRMAASKNKGN